MRIGGLTGLYKKTYLDDNLFRFEFSRHIIGYLDDVTGDFTDEFGNIYSNVRDVSFLDSKDIEGFYGFLSFDDIYKFYPDVKEINPDIFFHDYDERSKRKMLFVSIVNDGDEFASDTVLTEVDLDEIHKRGIKYYFDYIDSIGKLKHAIIHKNAYDLNIEKVENLIKMGAYNLSDLENLLIVFEEPYDITCNIVDCCEIAFEEMQNKMYKSQLNKRNPKIKLKEPYNCKTVIDLLEKRQLTIKELKDVYRYFLTYRIDLESLFEMIKRESKVIRKRMDEYAGFDDKEDDYFEENASEYSLDNVVELRNAVKEYLVGQDEALERFTTELTRMKSKNYNDNVGILLSGDSGVGKTYMVQLIADYLGVPFVRVDSTSLTSPGYSGRDLEEVVYELYEKCGKDVKKAEYGIIFFDEIDKKGSGRKDDVAGQAVLNHLLTLLDGSDIYAVKSTKAYGPQDEVKINSKHMVIIAAGSFPDVYKKKGGKTGFIKEEDDYVNNPNKTPKTNVFVEKAMMTSDFMNRLPIRIRLNSLSEKDFEINFISGKDSPLKWEEMTFAKHGVTLKATIEFIKRASVLSLEEDSGFRGSKGIILAATAEALNDVITNEGKYSEIILTEETLDNPKVYIKK